MVLVLTRAAGLTLTLALALVACTEDDSLENLVDRYVAVVTATSSAFCRCPNSLGFETSEECMEDPVIGIIDEQRRNCIVDALEQDEEAARHHLECLIPVEQDFARCLTQTPDCVDLPFTLEDCLDRYADDAAQCGELPESIADAFMACWSSSSRDAVLVDRLR
jgi:hypothetical protein